MIKVVFKWSKWISAGVMALLVLLLTLIALLLFTHPGLTSAIWVAEKVVPQLQVGQVQGALFPKFTLRKVTFNDAELNIASSVDELTLAMNFQCLLEPKVCINEISIDGLALSLPQLPPSSESVEEPSEPLKSISTPVPVFLHRLALTNIQLDVLGNQISWGELSSALSMQGDRLVIAPTRFSDIDVTLAPSEPQAQSAAPNEAPRQDIELPEVWIPLQIVLQRFDVNRFTLHQETPLIVNHLALEAKAGKNRVDVETLELDMPQVSAQANAQVELKGEYPLSLDLKAKLKETDLKGQNITLNASQSVAHLQLQSTLSGPVSAQLSATLEPLLVSLPFDVKLSDLQTQWPLSGESDYQIKATNLMTQGSLEGYQLALQSQLEGKEIPAITLDVHGSGDLQHIDLDKLNVETLGGELKGQVMANWQSLVNWRASLQLQNIQPGLQWPEAEGNISGKLATTGSLTEKGGWKVALPELDIDGLLRGYPLNIEGSLHASDEQGNGEVYLDTERLTLSHGPNGLTAKGQLKKEWQMDVDIHFTDLAKSVPDLSGSVAGEVDLRGALKEPDIQLALQAQKIQWQQQASIEQLSLTGRVTPLPEPQADVTLKVAALRYQEQLIDSILLSVSGGEKQHQLSLDVSSDLVSTSLAIHGGLQQKPQMVWSGELERMFATTQQGTWTLQQATAIKANIDQQQVDVAAHCWQQQGSTLCLTKDIRVGEKGEAELALNQFDFAQIAMFLPPETKLDGSVDATVWAKWAPESSPQAKVSLHLPTGQVQQKIEQVVTLGWDDINLNAQLHQDQLNADWQINVSDNGDLTGQLQVADVQASDPQLKAKLALSQFNLDFLAPLVGEYSALKALISTDLSVSGSAYHPQVKGQFLVDDIQVNGDISPIDVKQGKLAIDFRGYDADLAANIVTPDGELNVSGEANWQQLDNWHSKVRVFADSLKVDMPPMVKIKLVPDMTIEVNPTLAKVTGSLALPWGRIVVEELPPSAVSVSKDQVLLNDQLEPIDKSSSMPFNVETDINISIGDDFKLAAFGLEGGLKGQLNVTQKDKGPFILGEVNIVDGTYRSFGQDLLIKEGKVLMNGPADQPYVAIKAIRNPENTQDDVIAGVKVTGPATEPSITIFSEPAMPQANALSYLLRGQDIDGESGGGNAMTTALIGLSLAKSGKVVGEIGQAFGVQDLQLDTAGSGEDSQVTVSGYIMPGLQVKYGVGIFKPLGEFTVRYRLMKDLYLEGVSGVESAVDLLYQFEFD
ncbi:autotransporter assembly complex protein TamB [Vibrio vulnificus]|uniref:autotransporter assembly complex protein TamB n=1 Tax=Vibrio vulnificus TaxID=672 RepID=UPI001A26D5B0|nr:translocation/assembly module TamB domain-containing protein [Vibrio vulnificus]MCA0771470.1 translocation/assembly module TamB [Vibrio vulnificus]HAS6243419.1 translocation/assembly module TamB [Vibrio vulnificus]HAS6299315.1 translocation/assembly module TamB [Vibrio vulnificus]HDY7433438.1 translocation/assembly module TamB [Vibrio vulnificus]HDY7571290.1 translocation/assembly module TamB [Vibrio vulnificus]